MRYAGPVLVPMRRAAIPRSAAATLRTASLTVPVQHFAAAPANRWYVVRPGDTLYGIAKKHDTEVDELRELNHLAASARIHPGLRLRIPTE
jgi:LysM repeat protein